MGLRTMRMTTGRVPWLVSIVKSLLLKTILLLNKHGAMLLRMVTTGHEIITNEILSSLG